MRGAKLSVRKLILLSIAILSIFLILQPLQVYHFQDYISVLFPKGLIGIEERNLLLLIQVIMLLVIIPVYILTFVFSWKYRASNKDAEYDPDLVDSPLAEVIWWGLPFLLTMVVAVITWVKTVELDPYRQIPSDKKNLNIQVVALQWKWLFIYPDEGIATVNFLQIPKDRPVRFEITADAPMNSFWIPHLGGQIYAMPGMRTELNLIANETGDFRGSSANISGVGFAGMTFITRASSDEEYQKWLESAKKTSKELGQNEYKELTLPSENNPKELFLLKEKELFNQIIMKYMHP